MVTATDNVIIASDESPPNQLILAAPESNLQIGTTSKEGQAPTKDEDETSSSLPDSPESTNDDAVLASDEPPLVLAAPESKLQIETTSKQGPLPDVHESSKPDSPNNNAEPPFRIGDHVYKWCSFAGIPGMFQHHGIVMEINEDDTVKIADFNTIIRAEETPTKSLQLISRKRKGAAMQLYDDKKHEWKKVEYQASWWKRSLWRSGTCTTVKSDAPGLVLSRVSFLLDSSSNLPKYHFLKANCECVAVWCKTGTWATLQASTFLHGYAAGQVKSATTLALYATSQQVAVPSAGLWGWLGYTTKVSLLSTQPLLLPAIAGYGLVTVGGPVWILRKCKQFWNTTSENLNEKFWESALERPELFAECITEWSRLGSEC